MDIIDTHHTIKKRIAIDLQFQHIAYVCTINDRPKVGVYLNFDRETVSDMFVVSISSKICSFKMWKLSTDGDNFSSFQD